MPNHLHIVAVQGALPLADFMQPLLRRIAILVHARQGAEGHVFQRRYHSVPCTDPEYLRNAIAYVHLNAVRARLCEHPEQYPWSMHAEYSIPVPADGPERGAVGGLRLFSPDAGATLADTASNYHAFLHWRVALDACGHGRQPQQKPFRPVTAGGDLYWADRFGWSCMAQAERQRRLRPLVDLRDLALTMLRHFEPDMTLDVLRSGARTRALVAVRRRFIARAKDNGHRHRSIARFLHVSDVTVSQSS